jgi:hypothetical protein
MAPDMNSEELLPSQKSDVYVIPSPDGSGQFLVVPGTFGVPEDGKKIWIRNVTNNAVEVTFQSSIGSGAPVRIEHKKSEDFDLKKAAVGVYEYKVAVLIENGPPVLAQGGSNPRIVYG